MTSPTADSGQSIFREYYTAQAFVDRFLELPSEGVDVLIPIVHTNELWAANLGSIYREIPVNRLVLGDGGCTDDSTAIAQRFPRVSVLDQRHYKSLGFSIRKLIEAVETEWFIYLHSDVYLPPGWFEVMKRHRGEYDWFGCRMMSTLLVQYDVPYRGRPWFGSQMGRKSAFEAHLGSIDDDFVYRQEDLVFTDVVKRGGHKVGEVAETFHYHQTMRKPGPFARKVTSVSINVEMSHAEEIRTREMDAKALVKYLRPDSQASIDDAVISFERLVELGATTWPDVMRWVADTNLVWVAPIRRARRKRAMEQMLRATARSLRRMLGAARSPAVGAS